MKKLWKILLLAGVFTVLLCGSALAADGAGMCDVTEVTPQTAAGVEVSTTTPVDGKDVYVGAEKVTLTYTGAKPGSYYLVMALTDVADPAQPVPTASNIAYIDQKTAEGAGETTTVDFTVYPGKLESGKTYKVYLSSNDGTLNTLTEKGSFSYYASYTLGDANGDTKINVNDAMAVINHIVGKDILNGNNLLAADATGDGKVNINDAMEIINYIVGKPEHLGK